MKKIKGNGNYEDVIMKKYLIFWKLYSDTHLEFYNDEKTLNERVKSIEDHCFNHIHEIYVYQLMR